MFTANWVIIIVKDKFECQIVTSFFDGQFNYDC